MRGNTILVVVGLSVGILCFALLLKVNPSLPLWGKVAGCIVFGGFAASIARTLINP